MRFALSHLLFPVMILLLPSTAMSQVDDPFAVFKENVVETDCTVPRIGDSPRYGDTRIGEDDGAELTDQEARDAHDCMMEAMRRSLSASRLDVAREFTDWQRFSTGPYRSKDHHGRYVSNFVNAIAAENYARYEASGEFPVGSVLAKDSFVVSNSGRVLLGALSVMEKMEPGFNRDGGDWRYTLILPDGRVFGRTGTSDAYAVEFCQDCHVDSAQDHVFFLPDAYRVR
jgi:hypothetical protein